MPHTVDQSVGESLKSCGQHQARQYSSLPACLPGSWSEPESATTDPDTAQAPEGQELTSSAVSLAKEARGRVKQARLRRNKGRQAATEASRQCPRVLDHYTWRHLVDMPERVRRAQRAGAARSSPIGQDSGNSTQPNEGDEDEEEEL